MERGAWRPMGNPPVPRIYRAAATGLGAAMWFWIFYRAKKDGMLTNRRSILLHHESSLTFDICRTRPLGLEAPLGSLKSEMDCCCMNKTRGSSRDSTVHMSGFPAQQIDRGS
ncbi:hypothetical protein QBC38DRAFT_471288 [Podospora fimiseda]|uniref:Uncharacterized protein n=1 Tax=Podospora fimiseda TaxID=252190 RepID=A0AAN7H3E4_9PEZI|nr:hypothetical protein QBC38DRAFT_471288 [Podospora fimiseda]